VANGDLDTPAEEHFISRVPIFQDHFEATFQLINDWVKNCAEHPECNHDKSGVLSEKLAVLPTRVLEISGSHEKPLVRLVETNGQRADYCALSHCWGQIELITTTCDNFQKHLRNIPFDTLPKTFRDAVYLAQGIAIPYLWIDSLCIIQDNAKDWAREAKLMGGLYEKATLVIAAAGAEDSAGGLFFPTRPPERIIAVPYLPANLPRGTFSIAITSRLAANPYGHSCPLRNRAWSFQEWYLARRIVFFMPGGLTWNCRQIGLSERGSSVIYSGGNVRWILILEEYCRRRLTKKSDRLIAIQGIIDLLQRGRKSLFHSGVCADHIMEQLLWRVGEKFERGVLDMPSWSWAASECRKHWLMPYSEVDDESISVQYQELALSNDGALYASGFLLKLGFSKGGMLPCCRDQLFPRQRNSTLEDWMFQDLAEIERNSERADVSQTSQHHGESFDIYLVRTQMEDIIGLAVFDQHWAEDAVCFLAIEEMRHREDILYVCNHATSARYLD
jgi:hypothetical protein